MQHAGDGSHEHASDGERRQMTSEPDPLVPYYAESPTDAAELGDRLLRDADRDDRRILLRGGTVITMDPGVPDLVVGDVLVVGDRIEAVAPDLSTADAAAGATVVSAAGTIVIPGMVDSHRHCWQTQLRRIIPDVDDLAGYVIATHRTLAFDYRPEDIYIGNLLGVLGALDGGVTSVLDVSHNSRSAAHRDAAIQAHIDAGGRSVYGAHGALFGTWDEHWPDDLVRLQQQFFRGQDHAVTLRLACHGSDAAAARESADGVSVTLSPEKIRFARELGVGISVDGVLGADASANIESLGEQGLLGPDLTLIHMTGMSDRSWRLIADSGTAICLSPTSDAQIGIDDSLPPIQKALDFGLRPSLSVDTEASLSTDMFTQMRFILNVQRMGAFRRRHEGERDVQALSTRDVLEFATQRGADANGLGDVTGSITPGKQADLVLIRAEDVNNLPMNTAIGTVVNGADHGNVDTVLVGGRVRKWRGDLVGVDVARVRRMARESRDHLLERSGFALDPLL